MTYKQAVKVILLAIAISFLLNLFFGRFFAAKISTWSVLNKINLLDPQSPIVINTREEIRVNDGKDILEAIQSSRSKISGIVFVQNGQVVYSGAALNLAPEGLFVAHSLSFSQKVGEYYVVLSDGRKFLIEKKISDPATSLVFFEAKATNLPVINWGDSKELKVGEKLVFLKNSLQSSFPRAEVGFVKIAEKDIDGQIFDADRPSSSFVSNIGEVSDFISAVVNTKGEIVGLFDGKGNIISSIVIKKATAKYFSNKNKITRPSFGFTYVILNKTESEILNLPQGALVKTVLRTGRQKSSAFEAGLLEKDVIISVNSQVVNEGTGLDDILQKYNVGDNVKFSIIRGKESKELTLNLGELK